MPLTSEKAKALKLTLENLIDMSVDRLQALHAITHAELLRPFHYTIDLVPHLDELTEENINALRMFLVGYNVHSKYNDLTEELHICFNFGSLTLSARHAAWLTNTINRINQKNQDPFASGATGLYVTH